MEIKEITEEEYRELTGTKVPFFCRYEFLKLNEEKVEKIRYLLGYDRKKRLVWAVGEKEKRWMAPFSAPFSMIIELQKEISVEYYWEFVKLITEYAKNLHIQSINLFLPPDIYCYQQNARCLNAFLGNGYSLYYQDINYSLDLGKIDINEYESLMHRNARKNLHIALKSNLELIKCDSLELKQEAYHVIRLNREGKGYPLRMSLNQVMDTIQIVEHEFFLVKKDGYFIAAAIIFHVTDEIVQVIYWGDIPEVGEYKPINFLSHELIKYYKNKEIKYVDIGPSTEGGIPNFGLCNFKESIGCKLSSKYRIHMILN